MNTAPTSIQPAAPLTQLDEEHAEWLTFLIHSKGDINALQEQFILSALEVVEFLASPLVTEKLAGMLKNLQTVLQLTATQVQHTAMQHLQSVCTAFESQPEKLEKFRLSATALARLSASAGKTPTSPSSRRPAAQHLASAAPLSPLQQASFDSATARLNAIKQDLAQNNPQLASLLAAAEHTSTGALGSQRHENAAGKLM